MCVGTRRSAITTRRAFVKDVHIPLMWLLGLFFLLLIPSWGSSAVPFPSSNHSGVPRSFSSAFSLKIIISV
jgi:hypothetical protein